MTESYMNSNKEECLQYLERIKQDILAGKYKDYNFIHGCYGLGETFEFCFEFKEGYEVDMFD